MSQTLQTLLGVVLGAVLATLGGFAATQVTAVVDRRRRASNAALLCGEVLAGTAALMRLAKDARCGGPFDDSFPVRYLHAARREVEIYFRNRELIFSIPDADLRVRVHGFLVRVSMASDRLFDAHARMQLVKAGGGGTPGEVEALQTQMDQSMEYLIESRHLIAGLLARLKPLAGEQFDVYARIDAEGLVTDASAAL